MVREPGILGPVDKLIRHVRRWRPSPLAWQPNSYSDGGVMIGHTGGEMQSTNQHHHAAGQAPGGSGGAPGGSAWLADAVAELAQQLRSASDARIAGMRG